MGPRADRNRDAGKLVVEIPLNDDAAAGIALPGQLKVNTARLVGVGIEYRVKFEIQAIHFNADSPFVFTSGWASPVYVDCRKIISYPRLRSALIDFAASNILTEVGYESIDYIAGGETAGP